MLSYVPSGQHLRQDKRARAPLKTHGNLLAGRGRTRSATWNIAARVVVFNVFRKCKGKRQIATNRPADTCAGKPRIVTWIAGRPGGVNYRAVMRKAYVRMRTPYPAESSGGRKIHLVLNRTCQEAAAAREPMQITPRDSSPLQVIVQKCTRIAARRARCGANGDTS